jgi:UDP-glucose 4-epimerase
MKAIVTGSAGFIGGHLMRALQAEGHDVIGVDIKDGKDVRDTELMKRLFAGATYVFHLAALPRVQYSIEHPQETHEHNINGTLSVLVAARDAEVKRVIYAASSSAYGNSPVLPLTEELPAHPISPYGLQKYAGELYCRLFWDVYGLSTVSLRYFNVYGPGASAEGAYALVIAKFIQQRVEGSPMTITGDGEQTRDFTHVRDVVSANVLAATSVKVGKGEVINIGAGTNASVNRVAQLIGGPTEHIAPRLEPRDTLADNSLAKALLGWDTEVSLEEGISELKHLHNLP